VKGEEGRLPTGPLFRGPCSIEKTKKNQKPKKKKYADEKKKKVSPISLNNNKGGSTILKEKGSYTLQCPLLFGRLVIRNRGGEETLTPAAKSAEKMIDQLTNDFHKNLKTWEPEKRKKGRKTIIGSCSSRRFIASGRPEKKKLLVWLPSGKPKGKEKSFLERKGREGFRLTVVKGEEEGENCPAPREHRKGGGFGPKRKGDLLGICKKKKKEGSKSPMIHTVNSPNKKRRPFHPKERGGRTSFPSGRKKGERFCSLFPRRFVREKNFLQTR